LVFLNSSLQIFLRFGTPVAAIAWRNGIAMRARLRVPQKCANALIQFRADDVFKLAGLRMRFVVINAKCILEQAFRQPVSPHHIAGPRLSSLRQLHEAIL
jgi:hypothetical protein